MAVDARKFPRAIERVCETFKISSLYPEQETSLKALLEGKNVYASLSTGYGKSLIFFAAPVLFDEILERPCGSSKILVISPLKTLMEDQVAYLKSLGLSAIALHDEQSEERLKEVEKGAFTYLFASPEKMLSVERWRKLLFSKHYREFLVAITVDEAHCISQWGLPGSRSKQAAVPFRVWYGNLRELKSLTASDLPSIVLTATASPSTKKDIFRTLNLDQSSCHVIEHNPERPNVQFSVKYLDKSMPVSFTFNNLIEELRVSNSSCQRTMIFCQTRKQCALLYSVFKDNLGNDFYLNKTPNPKERMMEMFHSGTPESVKKHILDNISRCNGHIRVIACTIAFGMGVNCKGVHRIVHFGPAKNLECYVQECGRAGRDGQPSTCILLHNGLLAAHCADDIKDYLSNDKECRRTFMYSYFPGEFSSNISGHQCCDICSKSCRCGQESFSEPGMSLESNADETCTVSSESVRSVKEMDKIKLRGELFKFMKDLLIRNTSGAIASVNIMHEFTSFYIQQVLDNYDKIKTLSDVEDFVEDWRKEHSRGILAAIHRIFGDVDEDEIKTPECEDKEMDEHAQEWANIRDDSELCNLLNDSDLQHVDVHMEEIDVSGNEQRNMSSMIGNLFKSF